jgi:SAM-dependent methyltransferase
MERGIDVNFGITPPDVIERALDLLNVNANSFVLDIGCGDGRALKLARDRGARVLGIECSRLRYRLAQRLLSSFSSNVSVIHGNYRDVVIPAGVTHLFSFLWPGVTERVIDHVQHYVRAFRGVSVIHPLPGKFDRVPLSKKQPGTWFGYFYHSNAKIAHTLRPLKLSKHL